MVIFHVYEFDHAQNPINEVDVQARSSLEGAEVMSLEERLQRESYFSTRVK